jgi:hypothetical protein
MKKHQHHWRGWLAVLSLFLLLACQKDPQPLQTRLDILVVDAQQKPIVGIEIVIEAYTGSYFAGTRKKEYYGSFKTAVSGRILFERTIPSNYMVSIFCDSPGKIITSCPKVCDFFSGDKKSITVTVE